jgi:predicted transcriptional regulator
MVTKYVPHKFAKDTTTRTEIPDFMSPSVISVGSNAMIQETTQFINKKNIDSFLNFKKKNDEYISIVKETDLSRKILVRARH